MTDVHEPPAAAGLARWEAFTATILGAAAPRSDPARVEHWDRVAARLLEGKVTPFLGAGSSAAAPDAGGEEPMPTATKLAEILYGFARNPRDRDKDDLPGVSQFIEVTEGWGPLYEQLRVVFTKEYRPQPLHEFLAVVPSLLREKGAEYQQLIVTTNYDDLLETAFTEAGEPFDLVTYIANPRDPDRGRFRHTPPDGEPVVIEKPNDTLLPLDERPTILKVHGTVDKESEDRDGFVIAEDNYIDFLAGQPLMSLIPTTANDRLQQTHILFLAYGLEDWNLRVFFRRAWGEDKGRLQRWAVQRDVSDIDSRYWTKRDVELLDIPLDAYLVGLVREVQNQV